MNIEISDGYKTYIHPYQKTTIKEHFESERKRIDESIPDETFESVLDILKS